MTHTLLTPFHDDMITNGNNNDTDDGADEPAGCADCNAANRFCVAHLRTFVSGCATKRDQHARRMAAYQASVARQEAAERRRLADGRLDRTVIRLISPGHTRPRDLGRLLMLAVERHEAEAAAIALDLAVVLGEQS